MDVHVEHWLIAQLLLKLDSAFQVQFHLYETERFPIF